LGEILTAWFGLEAIVIFVIEGKNHGCPHLIKWPPEWSAVIGKLSWVHLVVIFMLSGSQSQEVNVNDPTDVLGF
jgi:hypothetical protein